MATVAQQLAKANEYGWMLAVLRSIPEISKLFDQAVAREWDGPTFVAKLRSTRWYRSRGETARQNEILRAADPAEYKRRANQTRVQVQALYKELTGRAVPSERMLKSLVSLSFMGGYSTDEIRELVGKHVNTGAGLSFGLGGQLGQAERQIRTALEDYGLDFGENWVARQLAYVAQGKADPIAIQNYLRAQAKGRYPAYAQELDQGMTIRDVAEPFRQLMAKTLELSDKSIGLTDPTLQKALTHRSAKSATRKSGRTDPIVMPLWEFEQQLTADPRWLKTQNAQDRTMAAGRKVLTDMGLLGSGG